MFVKFEIVVCKLFQFGGVKNLSSGNGLNNPLPDNNNFFLCWGQKFSGKVENAGYQAFSLGGI